MVERRLGWEAQPNAMRKRSEIGRKVFIGGRCLKRSLRRFSALQPPDGPVSVFAPGEFAGGFVVDPNGVSSRLAPEAEVHSEFVFVTGD
jgi:hypothetical protein